MLKRLGIEDNLQFALTLCILTVIVVTTLGNSGGAPWAFFTYRTALLLLAVLSIAGCRRAGERISSFFLGAAGLLLALMVISVLRIQGSHFEGLYLWYKYVLFACAFLGLAKYSRYRSPIWKGFLLGAITAVGLVYVLQDLITKKYPVAGFSPNNTDYFGTFLLIGLAVALAAAVFGQDLRWRAAAGVSGALTLFGIFKTTSRGATLAAAVMIVILAIRGRNRIARPVWLMLGLLFLVAAIVSSPYLIQKFTDRGEHDPYNYARIEIWRGALPIIAHNPIFGVGFGQYFHISKRYTLPIDGAVARYLKRAQMAHSEYLQHVAEQGIPAALILFSLLGYLIYLVWKRAGNAWPEQRIFHEAALLTAAGVGLHAAVDNCWTIPVTASALIVLSMADPLPLAKKESWRTWTAREVALAAVLLGAAYVVSTLIPGMGLYYNDMGHQAYDRNDYAKAEQYHLKAIRIAPDNPLFLDNLGMVYLQASIDRKNPALLVPAHTYLARAISACPQSLEPHIHMETLLLRSLSGDPARDSALYREIIQVDSEMLTIDPYVPFPRKNLAGAYYNLGDSAEAFKQVQLAIHYEPNYVPGYLQLASWYADSGNVVANRQYTAAATTIVEKYRNFKPTEIYEAILLGRPTLPGDTR
ncbi:MAG TPA: O-antigen ligase family protein [Terriglobia bacterium]|jgi:O-antigen ligase